MDDKTVDESNVKFLGGRYELRNQLGSGGQGEVYLAWDRKMDRQVAIKLMDSDLDPIDLRRYEDEVEVLVKLHDPNIVTVYDKGIDNGRRFFVMEYVEGVTLSDFMKSRGGRLDLDLALEITRQVASALTAAHQVSIYHRDIKPANIFISGAGKKMLVKVIDFGIAAIKDNVRTDTVGIVGTPAYISPEQILTPGKAQVDQRTDLYSLGAVVYEMLTGELIFGADSTQQWLNKQVFADPVAPSIRNTEADIPKSVDEVILKALKKNPGDRYDSVNEFYEALKLAAQNEKQGVTIDPAPAAGHRAYSYSLAVVSLLIVALVVWWLYFDRSIPDKPGDEKVINASSVPPAEVSKPSESPKSPDFEIEISQFGIGKVDPGKIFRSGDTVQLNFSSARGGYLYILQFGTNGNLEILYPDRRIAGSYDRVNSGQIITFPSSGFRFDKNPGTETLYAVFTAAKGDAGLADLESVIERKERSLDADRQDKVLEMVQKYASGKRASATVSIKKIDLIHGK